MRPALLHPQREKGADQRAGGEDRSLIDYPKVFKAMQMPEAGRGSRRTIFAKRSQFACSLSSVGSNLMAGSFLLRVAWNNDGARPTEANWLAFGKPLGQSQSRSIKVNQGQSRSIKVNQGQSRSIKVNQGQSRSIKVHQGPSRSIKVHQGQLAKVTSKKVNQGQSRSIKVNQGQSRSIKVNQGQSRSIKVSQGQSRWLKGRDFFPERTRKPFL